MAIPGNFTKITFTQDSDGLWKGTFTSDGKETSVYLNRAAEGFLLAGSHLPDTGMEDCVEYKEEKAPKDASMLILCPDGAVVTVVSETRVLTAYAVV